jgi:hypothetical protein
MFGVAGTAMVAGIFVALSVFLIRYYFQSTRWKDFFYKDAYVFAGDCGARFSGSDSLDFPAGLLAKPFRPIGQLPHPRGFFDSWRGPDTSKFYHAEYQCVISTAAIRIGRGANYMHLGWLFGEHITVGINGRQVLELRGEDFVSLPLAYEDMTRPDLRLTVRVSSSDGHRFGFASLLPPAITTETKAHLNIFAIQPVFEVNNAVLPRMPTMCFGVLLAFAWLLGIRTRVMLTGMFYFVADLAGGTLMLMGPFLPVGATKVHTLGLPLSYLAQLAAICLLLEVFGIMRTRIYSLMNFGLAISVVSFVALLAWDGVFAYSQIVTAILDGLFLAALVVFLVAGVRVRLGEPAGHNRRLMTATLFVAVALTYRYGHELSRHLSWYTYFNISFYYSLALPMFLTGLVLYHLTAVEGDLQRTAREKEVLSRRLGVKEDLLAIVRTHVSPAEPVRTELAEIRWSPEVDGVWSVAWECESGATVLMHGQMLGGAEQAGLGMTAITGTVIGWREERPESPAACIERLSQILNRLFRGYVRTSVTAIRIEKEGLVDIWTAGGDGSAPVVSLDGHRVETGPTGAAAGAAPFCRPSHVRERLNPGALIRVELADGRISYTLNEIRLAA